MSIENVKFVESIVFDKDDPRVLAIDEDDDTMDFVQNKNGDWYLRRTREPVTSLPTQTKRASRQG
jgi:hypothetical protein